ncbi:NADH-quinone oxidoreductase subunit E [Sinorhizobium mexicanum]|uniref:NADH-quinone oxidoreductase subunit E n=1 Tax=Sinorhizobium mexicanum TaxID=375549 RepID=A0A859QE93_9HYPH|nr:NADH-quinone oxidoreductase subunit E [Sinorhizobium mexicanum]MBP1882657.1 NADH-quinone oxidoreductase subunit E [Sinorhizobium mexicanum]QLL61184.1 NADH-quinone oxidoreductase subunit E [Sinorhizobium mexicanum]
MSVRRLAEDTVQPASFAFNKENAAWAKATIKKYPKGREQSAVIPLLMRAQEQDGWVTKAAIESVADMLGMPYIRVLEVATFYTQFQLKPVGTRAHVQVCGTTPCMLRGAEDLIRVCKSKIASEPFALNESGTLSWEEVECQGACVNAPMVMIFKDTFEDLTAERLEQIIDSFEAGKGTGVTPGPQIDRVYSAPIGGPTTLLTQDPAKENSPAPANPGRAKKVSSEPAVSIPPANAARAKTASAVTNPTLKTPVTARKEAAAIAKIEGETIDKSKPAKPAVAGRPSLEDKNRPAAIEKPVAVDDLKLISGVGPKIEATLHEIGIFTFAQVASWKKAEREWVDGYLNFTGRIERDDWVKQAKALAKGGEAEYIKVFGKKPR